MIATMVFSFMLGVTSLSNSVFLTLEDLAKNDPKQAVQLYQQTLKREDLSLVQLYRLHYLAIRASAQVYDNKTLISAINELKKPQYSAQVSENKAKILSNIGVAYRLREQNKAAVTYYRCALELAEKRQYKSAIKINIAIAYTRMGQPAIGYNLLTGIEQQFLPDFMRAGLSTALGNAATAIGKIDQALQHYNRAIELYANSNNQRAIKLVSLNSAGLYLINRYLNAYEQAMATLADDEEINQTRANYLTWLREVAKQLVQSPNRQTLVLSDTMATALQQVASETFANIVNAHIAAFDIPTVAVQEQIPERDPLPLNLTPQWCQ